MKNIIDTEIELEQICKTVKTVAVVGMRGEEHTDLPAYLIPKRVQSAGIRVIPVNPKIKTSLGETAYSTLAEVPHAFNMINVFRRAEALGPLADEIISLPKLKWPSVVWIQTGIINQEAAEKLAAAGMKVVMDYCLGVYVARYRR